MQIYTASPLYIFFKNPLLFGFSCMLRLSSHLLFHRYLFFLSAVDQCPFCFDQPCGFRHHCYCREALVPVTLDRQHPEGGHLGLD